jgi:hypothetical protein
MNTFKALSLAAAAAVIGFAAPASRAQPAIGVAPECPYGYYDSAPYGCAPYGYYGPEWFAGGIFIGAGPWFHGPYAFRGHVNHRFDVRRGYRGPLPTRGELAHSSHPLDRHRNARRARPLDRRDARARGRPRRRGPALSSCRCRGRRRPSSHDCDQTLRRRDAFATAPA